MVCVETSVQSVPAPGVAPTRDGQYQIAAHACNARAQARAVVVRQMCRTLQLLNTAPAERRPWRARQQRQRRLGSGGRSTAVAGRRSRCRCALREDGQTPVPAHARMLQSVRYRQARATGACSGDTGKHKGMRHPRRQSALSAKRLRVTANGRRHERTVLRAVKPGHSADTQTDGLHHAPRRCGSVARSAAIQQIHIFRG